MTEGLINEPVILIDVMNLVFRQHWALPNLQHEGKHTGVQYGVLKTINQLRTNVSTRMIFVWDHGVPVPGAQRPRNWREAILPAYKGNRKRDPDVHDIVVSQLKDLHDVISCLGYSHVSVMGLEADDMIGLLSQAYPEVCIFSTDKDFYQLLDEARVHVVVPKKDKKEFKKIFQSDVEREYELPTSRFAEYLALGGDGCDNIKPLKGMGPKTAIKLILSGVNLNNTLDKQPKEFQEKYGHVWDFIQKSYYAARIPISWIDPRIASCVKKGSSHQVGWPPNPNQRSVNVKAFETWLAQRNMLSLLSIRRSFYENTPPQGQTKTCRPTSKHETEKSSNRMLI